MADQYICNSLNSISSASDLINATKSADIVTAEIHAEDIQKHCSTLERISPINAVPAAMKAHQVRFDGGDNLVIRDLACTCNGLCKCFNARLWKPVDSLDNATNNGSSANANTDGGELHAERSQHLKDRVQLMGLYILDNSGDGNCFFQSIADCLEEQRPASYYRDMAVQEIRDNPFYVSTYNTIVDEI